MQIRNLNLAICIPARMASTRFPEKPIALLHDKPMVKRVYDICKQSNIDGSFSNLRNERSTPTEFILPSSTAVANIQEQKKNSKLNLAEMNCLIIIDDIGFRVLDLKSPNNANSIAAIFEYQETQKLKTTGKLNVETRSKLGC